MDAPDLNDELKKISIDGLTQLGNWIHEAKDFAVDQAPKFAQEYAHWYVWSHAVWALVYFLAFSWCFYVGSRYARLLMAKCPDGMGGPDDYWWSGFWFRVAGFGAAAFFFFHVGWEIEAAGKGYFAPRVVLVEGIREIVKGETSCQGGKR